MSGKHSLITIVKKYCPKKFNNTNPTGYNVNNRRNRILLVQLFKTFSTTVSGDDSDDGEFDADFEMKKQKLRAQGCVL